MLTFEHVKETKKVFEVTNMQIMQVKIGTLKKST